MQQLPGQSVSTVHSALHFRVSALEPTQCVPSQHVACPCWPQAAPASPQVQYTGAAQKPLVLSEKNMQQPVSGQSASLVQRGRQPLKSGLSDVTHAPRQQSLGIVELPGMQASPRFLHGLSQAACSAQIRSPVSRRSVQQPLSQSAPVVQDCSQTLLPLPLSTQASSSQQGIIAQLRPVPMQSPARAAGLLQLGLAAPASPVQKHEASSKVMHVKEAQ
jgi:hypothetical protein